MSPHYMEMKHLIKTNIGLKVQKIHILLYQVQGKRLKISSYINLENFSNQILWIQHLFASGIFLYVSVIKHFV